MGGYDHKLQQQEDFYGDRMVLNLDYSDGYTNLHMK